MLVNAVDAAGFLDTCRSLFEEMKLRCGAQASDEYLHENSFGSEYRVCPLSVFGLYHDSSQQKLAVVLYERPLNERGEGFAEIGLISPIPGKAHYAFETLRHTALLYIALSVVPRHLGIDLQADLHRANYLLEHREFRDILCFVEDAMFEKVAKFLPLSARTGFGERGIVI